MKVILLATSELKPIPETIDVVKNFGYEIVIDEANHEEVAGDVVLVKGEEKDFIKWLKPFKGFWTTNNPASGQWEVVHIK
jgi:hypothetical protein